jgi:colicin import membrane protein
LANALRETARKAIDAARERAEAERQAREEASQIDVAQTAFRRGHRDEALAALRGFVALNPGAVAAQQELERLAAQVEREAAEAAARAVEIRKHRDQARVLMEADMFEAAVDAAQRAIACDWSDAESLALFAETLERDTAARIQRERERTEATRRKAAAEAVLAAAAAFSAGQFIDAAKIVEHALRLSPSSREARELGERVRLAMTTNSDDPHPDTAAPAIVGDATAASEVRPQLVAADMVATVATAQPEATLWPRAATSDLPGNAR